MKILFIGQDTFKITLKSGKTLLTDPWFKDSRLWRTVPPAFSPEQIGRIDYMLPSHNHLDHVDDPSLELAKKQDSIVIGSKKVAERAKKFGVRQVFALAPGDEKMFDNFSVKATPAFHPMARDAIGFLIRTDNRQIYFSGDTRPDPALTSFLKAAGKIDLAFLQASCARYFGKDDGLDLITSTDLALAIKPAIAVPMHFHTRFKKKSSPEQFAEILKNSGIQVLIFKLDEEKEIFE
jgi:L-ascorbate metabolism protein UlaG (beta-lactamase superfamily)